MKATLAVLDKNGNNAVNRTLEVLNVLGEGQTCNFGLISPKKAVFEKNLGLLRRQGIDSPTVAGFVSSKPRANGYEFLQLDDSALVFEGRVYAPMPKNAVIEKVAKDPQHCEGLLQTLLSTGDGDYMFFLLKEGWIAAGRDPVGVQPLYFGENKDIAAFATNRKALWKLGIENPASFPPGNLAFLNPQAFQFKPVKTLPYKAQTAVTLDEAAKKLQFLLEESIRRRTREVKEVAVAFSGGLDSSLVAYMASKMGLKVTLLHVSMENQMETEEAIEASDKLNLPIEIDLFKDSDVEATLPQVVALIEEADPVKAAVGLPFFWTAKKAVEEGLYVMLAGQGADELFGGYLRYVNEFCRDGEEAVRGTMYNDVVRICESNLERDLKITGWFDVELRLPFAWVDLAEFALGLPIECKMEPKKETLRKLVLRKVASNIGVPQLLVDKPKKAVQYSTGINDAIKRVGKKQGKTVNEYLTGLFENFKN